MKYSILFSIIWLLIPGISVTTAADNRTDGFIKGQIRDAETNEPLVGVNVILYGTTRGASTDEEGEYRIDNVAPGVYTLEIRYIGYDKMMVPDVVVRPNRPTTINKKLSPSVIEGDEITVTGSYFSRDAIQPISKVSFSPEELRRSPGSAQEISRVLSAVPGVASLGDMNQDLLVRGGSPSEVGFFVDNIPIPSIKHFTQQNGSSNGPIGVINTDLVEDIEFSTGGFKSSYGNHLSAIGDIKYRQGNRERIMGQADFNMAGFGGNFEGPIGEEGKGSWLISGRRSYLDIIADAINAGGAPRYADAQAKGVYDLDKNNRISLLNIFGYSSFTMDRSDAEDMGLESFANATYHQNTAGINWRHLYGKNMYSNLSLSHSFKTEDTKGIVAETGENDFLIENTNQHGALRYVAYASLGERSKIEFGAESRYVVGDFEYFYSGDVDRTGEPTDDVNINQTIDGFKSGVFATYNFRPVSKWSVAPGVRLSHNSFNNDINIAPRFSTSFQVNSRWSLNLASGVYYQSLPLYFLSQNSSIRDLPNVEAIHAVAGIDYMITSATKFTIEAYYKRYNDVPLQPETVSSQDPTFVLDHMDFYDNLNSDGTAYSRGVDLMIQKKMKDQFYGTISASFFRSRYRDQFGEWQNRDYDVKYLFNIIGGYRPNKKWEISARWSYIGARPYTPINVAASQQMEATVLNMNQFNEKRLPAYHSLFLRFDRRYFFENTSLTTYVSLWNAYNRENVHSYHWDSVDSEIAKTVQFSLLPVGGVEFEF